jgi:hypothetical protein
MLLLAPEGACCITGFTRILEELFEGSLPLAPASRLRRLGSADGGAALRVSKAE